MPPTPLLDELKAQLAQLDELITSGVLQGDAARAARERLEAQVLAAVLQPAGAAAAAPAVAPATVPMPTAQPKPSRRTLVGVTVFVLAFGAVGYAVQGNRAGLLVEPGMAGPTAAASAPHEPSGTQIEAMAQRLAERLQTTPDDAEGWTMLGRSYSVLGKHAQALQAFQRVVALRPKDAQAYADVADAMGMVANRKLDGAPEKLIAQALQLDPTNAKALALAGSVAFERGDGTTAARLWEAALSQVEPGSDTARQLQAARDEALQLAGAPAAQAAPTRPAAPAAVAQAAPAASGAAASVQARITLAPGLAAQAAPDDTVFIFARAVQGGRAPLAIQRRQVKDLPLELVLDDSMAMSPSLRISAAAQVVIGARITKSGNAMPQPGDLQGLSAPVALGARGVRVEIADTVR